MRLLLSLACLAATACAPAAKPARNVEAETQWKLSDAARAQGDLVRAQAAAETAFLFEATTHARDLIVLRAEAFSRASAVPSEAERVTMAWQAAEAVKSETSPAARASLLAALARASLLTGDQVAADAELNVALQVAPSHVGALLLLAHRTTAQGRWREAIGIYERVLAADSSNQEVLRRYGLALLMVGDADRAIRFLAGAVTLSKDPEVTLQLVDALELKSRGDEAIGVLERALAVDQPDSPQSPVPASARLSSLRRRLGALLLDAARPDDAERQYRQAQFEAPDAVSALGLAEVELARGHVAQAAAIVEREWAAIPAAPRPLWVASMALSRAGRGEDARHFAEQYIQLAVHDPREVQRLPRLLAMVQTPPAKPK